MLNVKNAARTMRSIAVVATVGFLILGPVAGMAAPGPTDWSTGTISVVGEGAPPEGGTLAKKRLLAKRAAVVDAYRKLAEAVHGVQVDSQTQVQDLEVQSDTIRASVSGLIKGAQIVEENITSDGAYEVRVEMPIFGANSLASVVLESSLNRYRASTSRLVEPSAQALVRSSTRPAAAQTKPVQAYTGVIVDARDLGAKAAMMPALFDEAGQELYFGKLPISDQDIIARGPVAYVKTLEEAKASPRVGATPLLIRAKRYQGPFHADLILFQSDADKLREATQAVPFLKDMAVVLVI